MKCKKPDFRLTVSLAIVTACLVISFTSIQVMASSLLSKRPTTNHDPVLTLNEYWVDTPHITLPFHLIDGLLMIEGQVNNIPGRFLFDTGTPFPFFLNNNLLPLSQDSLLVIGTTASGQELVLYTQNDPIEVIELAEQIRFEDVRSLPHADWSFVEQILGERFLGTVGYGFSRNYLFVINYDMQTIDLYSLNQEDTFLAHEITPERIITTLNFEIDVEGHIPEIELFIGDEQIKGVFDTGDHGTLVVTEETKTTLERAGYLNIGSSDYLYGIYEPYTHCTLTGLSYDNQTLTTIHNLQLETGDENRLVLGYQFLKHYITAWNYKSQTITLLSR
jgi:hypothetical protein